MVQCFALQESDLPEPGQLQLSPLHRGWQTRKGTVQKVDRIYAGDGKVGYLVYADGERFLLDLERDETLGSPAPGSPALSPLGQAPSPRCLYRGTVNSEPESLAAFNLCGALRGLFAVGRSRYTVSPLSGSGSTGLLPFGGAADQVPHLFTRDRFSFQSPSAEASRCEIRSPAGQPAARIPQTRSSGRSRRSVSRLRHVELLLVADQSMSHKYGDKVRHYLLTLASIASKLFGHASIENPVRLAVVRIIVLTGNDQGPVISKNAASTLHNFCRWQHKQNQVDPDHAEHYDAAILFTRE
eukprot:g33975.t1